MRKERTRRHVVQLDLFRPMAPKPLWRSLPPEVTPRVKQLLVRLLQEHRVSRHAPQSEKEGSDER